ILLTLKLQQQFSYDR
ncbi:unnamed protein product, partial [Rotaria sp. Silwood2]